MGLERVIARLISTTPSRTYDVLSAGLVIGSDESAALRDTDSSVQSRHCRISAEAGVLYAEDLNSTHGTFLNGVRLDGRARLAHGDVLRCGTSRIELVCDLTGALSRPEEHAAAQGSEHELSTLRARLDAVERELRGQQALAAGQKAELANLKQALAGAHERMTGHREREQQLQSELARARAEVERLTARLEHERELPQVQLQDANQTIAELQALVDELQRELRGGNAT